jgi:predicted nucleic acid-binding protein
MFANRFTAVIDACVLCSPLKRGLILSLAEAEFFQVRWSDQIMNETEKAITIILSKKDHSDAVERATQARNIMNQAFAEATIVEYEHHGNGIGKLPDEGDRHVIAAAIEAKADFIVTENLKDFPRKVLVKYGIKAKSSDEFIADAISLSPSLAISAVKRMRLRLNKQDKTPEILLLDMKKTGLIQSVDRLEDSVKLI